MSKKKPKKPPRRPTTRTGWLKRWRRSLEIVRNRIELLLLDRGLYLTFQQTVEGNADLDPKNEFFDFIHRHYWNHLVVGIRSIDDPDWRSHSLLNLMKEIHDQAALLDEAWFVRRYKNKSQGEYQYKRDWSGKAHISQARIHKNIRELKKITAGVRKLVNKYVAHNGRIKPRSHPTYAEVSSVLDGLFELMGRYHSLLFNSARGLPVDLTFADSIFDVPWRRNGAAAAPSP